LHRYQNWETESSLFVIPKHTAYDVVILGSSHGRIFSSSKNHLRVENILNKKILNISKQAGGLLPEKLFLHYFYWRNNTTPNIIFFIDPAFFYSDRWNEKNFFLEDEPLRLPFLLQAWRNGVNQDILINYVRSKFSIYWMTSRTPKSGDSNLHALEYRDPAAVTKRLKFLYFDGLKEESFDHYTAILRDLVVEAASHHTKITFIFPTTLLGDLPGTPEVKAALAEIKKDYPLDFYDYSNAITDVELFNDHDHLNTAGVVEFSKKYLKPLTDTMTTTTP
jgi:hypothetical protein